ncbi:MAG: hypothetical protein H6684_15475 [Deltaproteobacteria bacterium]|nr:hypothetical protein [Deltaproteobacteria bacterium]MCB9490130.1 hypothetical protein [Deltaproteobacteria bacterium]
MTHPSRGFFDGQLKAHGAYAATLVISSIGYALATSPMVRRWGDAGPPDLVALGQWFVVALALPYFHQQYVWLVWRSELLHKGMTRLFRGNTKKAFRAYATGFFIGFALRPIPVILCAYYDRTVTAIPFLPAAIVAAILLVPAAYAGYSVKRYFGMLRATGEDHFIEEAKTRPFVRQGMFKYSSNAMYAYVPLLLWSIAIVARSPVALIAAVAQHGILWVHYYCTEKPDMARIYGETPKEADVKAVS